MPFKIKIQSNINEQNLDQQEIKEIISSLEDFSKAIRGDLYSYFLGKRSLRVAGVFIGISAALYLATEQLYFMYIMFFGTLIIMLASVFIAEAATKITQKQIKLRIQSLKERLEVLTRTEAKSQ